MTIEELYKKITNIFGKQQWIEEISQKVAERLEKKGKKK